MGALATVKRILAVSGLCALMLQSGCSVLGAETAASVRSQTEEEASDAAGTAEDTKRDGETDLELHSAQSGLKRGGLIKGDNAGLLNQQQWAVITDYLDRYYESIATFEQKDLSDLFTDSAAGWAAFNRVTWQYLIEFRGMQGSGLRLAGYYYELYIQELETREDGTVAAAVIERSVQNFARHPQINSEYPAVRHDFLLENQNGKWLLKEHVQWDGVFWGMYREFRGQDLNQIADAENVFRGRKDALLNEMREGLAWRAAQTASAENRQTDHPYDRSAAVAYARRFVGVRNARWPDFTGKGGNCQNFVSQCLLRGGIPIDLEGEQTWSWTGTSDLQEGPDDTLSWINVKQFDEYAGSNTGYGLAAQTDADFAAGAPGDVLKMGSMSDWNHAVMITDVIKDEQGNVIDYIICSNTTDVRDFPASAYPLPRQSLTKIYGWNDAPPSETESAAEQ